MVKMSKMAENWGFAPYSGLKNAKNGGFLRVCGRKMVGGAIKIPFVGVGNTKNARMDVFLVDNVFSDVCRTVRIL